MESIYKILKGLLAVTIIGISIVGFGGITIFGITYVREAEKLPTEADKKADDDLKSKQQGEEALKKGEYLKAIHFFSYISDDSTVVTNKAELIEKATNEYLSYILSEVDNELENNNFNRAKNLLEEALTEIPENEKLLEKLTYVSLREELYALIEKDTPESVLTFIITHKDIFGNDKFISETWSDTKDTYLTNVISDSNDKSNSHEYDSARSILSSAEALIGKDSKIDSQRTKINKEEVKYNISIFKDKEDWYGLYKYINSLEETLKNDNISTLKTAKNKMISITISDSNKYLKNREYDSAKAVLSDLENKIGSSDEINNQYKLIETTKVKDKISDMKENEEWRELIDYLNNSSLKDEYKNEYSNAVSKYKTNILKEAKNYIQNDGDYYSAYNVLEPAYDILCADSEYLKLYEECRSKGVS